MLCSRASNLFIRAREECEAIQNIIGNHLLQSIARLCGVRQLRNRCKVRL